MVDTTSVTIHQTILASTGKAYKLRLDYAAKGDLEEIEKPYGKTSMHESQWGQIIKIIEVIEKGTI